VRSGVASQAEEVKKRKKEHTGGKPQQTEKAEAVEKPETKGKR
jgi:hypothetical protein